LWIISSPAMLDTCLTSKLLKLVIIGKSGVLRNAALLPLWNSLHALPKRTQTYLF
jgi:hypothetical protein